MVEIRITKEIGNYEPKFIGPFTLRQTICVAIAAPICYFLYKYLSPIVTPDVAGFFCAIPGGIAALFGWIKPYGMHTEQFIRSVFINMAIAPSHRVYKTENQFEIAAERLMEEEKAAQEAASGEKKKKKLFRRAEKQSKKSKYKRSPKAIY